MEFKDRKIRIFDSVWNLKFENRWFNALDFNSTEEGTVYGITDPYNRIVRISLINKDGKPYSENLVKTTLLHELMHVIFLEGQYHDEYNDEPLVEWSAKCLNSLIKQHVF